MSPREKYVQVKSAFIKRLEECDQFHEIKEIFLDDLSIRRVELIDNPTDLINTLEAQSLIAEDTVMGFMKISSSLDDPGLKCITNNLVQEILSAPGSANQGKNQYEDERKNQVPLGVYVQQKKVQEESCSAAKRDKIFRIIDEQIGRKWMDFARGLGYRQGRLDKLAEHPKRIYVILEEVEAEKPQEFFLLILQALQDCKRNDIRKDVQKILLEK